MPLPYTEVSYIFGAARVAAPSIAYPGVVMGRAKRLHDLQNKGFFEPAIGDTGFGPEFALDYADSEFSLAPFNYPNLISGNSIAVDTVKPYLDNLKYIGLRQVSASLAAGDYLGIPVTKTSTRLVRVLSDLINFNAKPQVAHDLEIPTQASVSFGGSSIFNPDSGNYLVPGTFNVGVQITENADPRVLILTDATADQENTAEVKALDTHDSELPVTGQLYVYSAETFTVVQNTLRLNYATGQVTGSLIVQFPNATTASEILHANILQAAPMEMLNVARGDAVVFSRQGHDNSVGIQFAVTNVEATGSRPLFEGTENDLTAGELKARYLAGDPDRGPSDFNTVCEYIITSVDYPNGEVFGGSQQVYNETEEMDYRPHLGIAHIVTENRPRRLRKDVDYEINEMGPADFLGQITMNVDTLIINTRVRAMSATTTWAPTARNYDDDPSGYPLIAPVMTMDNFISGDFRVEYEEDVTSNAILNIAFFLNDKVLAGGEDALIDTIGQFDPRNMLGFGVGLVRKMSTVNFLILPYQTLGASLSKLQDIRRAFHIWNVSEDGTKAFSDWIDKENQPKPARFRIGYESKKMYDILDKVFPESGYAGAFSTDLTTLRRQLEVSGINLINLNVAPGDTFYDPETGEEYTVEFVSQTVMTFAERFSRLDDYSQRPMEDGPTEWTYQFESVEGNYPAEGGIRLKFKYNDGGAVQNVEGTVTEVAALGFVISVTYVDGLLTLTLDDPNAIGTPRVSAVPATRTVIGFGVRRHLTVSEMANLLVDQKVSNSMAYVSVLSKDIRWKTNPDSAAFDTFLPDYAVAGIIFAAKITFLPHMPLTEVSFDTFLGELGEVTGFRAFDRDEHLELLADAGYCMLNSLPGGKPYCESDFTAGYTIFGETDRGLLSKITPVLLYGKDTYEVTKKFKGPYNTGSPEFVSLINAHLLALKDRYVITPYAMLGTLLKEVGNPSASFDGPFVLVEHNISSQDPARYVLNKIYVD